MLRLIKLWILTGCQLSIVHQLEKYILKDSHDIVPLCHYSCGVDTCILLELNNYWNVTVLCRCECAKAHKYFLFWQLAKTSCWSIFSVSIHTHTHTKREWFMCPRGNSPPIKKYRDHSSPCNHTQHTAKTVRIDFVFTGQSLTGRGGSRVGNSTL